MFMNHVNTNPVYRVLRMVDVAWLVLFFALVTVNKFGHTKLERWRFKSLFECGIIMIQVYADHRMRMSAFVAYRTGITLVGSSSNVYTTCTLEHHLFVGTSSRNTRIIGMWLGERLLFVVVVVVSHHNRCGMRIVSVYWWTEPFPWIRTK